MPRYDYSCLKCKHIQEISHPMSGPTQTLSCEKCNSSKLEKIISSPYVRFDGPGWQTNDSRGIAKPNGAPDMDSSNFRE
jgi:putative FmdB family regulatory protein